MKFSSRRIIFGLSLIPTVGLICLLNGCGSRGIAPDSPQYEEVVSSFYVGLGAMESGEGRAMDKFVRVTELAPNEPAGWANLGLLQLRNNQLEEAAKSLEKARSLAPNNADIENLFGLLESKRANGDAAVKHFKHAAELAPENLRYLSDLAEQLQTQENFADAAKVRDQILQKAPDNLVAHLERAKLAAKMKDAAALQKEIAWFDKQRVSWPDIGKEMLGNLKTTAKTPTAPIASIQLDNVLRGEPRYRLDLAPLSVPNNQIGLPLEAFLTLPVPSGAPEPPDRQMSFTAQAIKATGKWQKVQLYQADGDKAPDAILMRENVWQMASSPKTMPFPGTRGAALNIDYDYDFKNDIALAGSKGFRLWHAEANGFSDVTAKTKLPPEIINGNFSGAWAADIEMDGDLDIVLAGSSDTPVLRNNGNGTFQVLRPFGKIGDVKDFAWGDIDDDGDPDAIFAAKTLQIFLNERSDSFRLDATFKETTEPTSTDIADSNRDGVMEDLTNFKGAPFAALSFENLRWKRSDILGKDEPKQNERIFTEDLDNNGAIDVILSGTEGTQIWLGGKENFAALDKMPDFSVYGVADINKDGRLDLLSLDKNGAAQWLINKGTQNYNWLDLKPQAQSGNVKGDGRINSFGIGGDVAVRSGLLYQKQIIKAPVVHFGLGKKSVVEIARIVWPNGDARAEFDLKGNQTVNAIQRLSGSCPYLFAWDGTKMSFITDCIWRSPLGLKINAQDTAGTMQTEDWLKLRGDQLKPKDGMLDLRITAELWETHFFDHLGLMSVDHPAGTEIWVDERLAFPQPPLKVHASRPNVPVKAWDDNGNDVSNIVNARDGKYLDNFGRGQYQGVTRDHWVEIEVPETLPKSGPLYLIAQGWIHPTDSSINVAIGQNGQNPPRGLSLEVPDKSGKWMVAKPGLGFPEGKLKTVVIRLDDAFKPGAPRHARLRTNLEIFWDSMAVAQGAPQTPLKMQPLKLQRADLRYRGFSEIKAADASSPELPTSYEKIQTTQPKWRDLIGYYTRFGDVQPLLTGVDDRYVIMNAGDEMQLSFAAPQAPPPVGWVRDWIMIGDGWVKDGNFNTAWSKTVIPLPAHDRPEYNAAPTDLWSDPVYRRHKSDWQTYHTRFVAPEAFRDTLRPSLSRAQ